MEIKESKNIVENNLIKLKNKKLDLIDKVNDIEILRDKINDKLDDYLLIDIFICDYIKNNEYIYGDDEFQILYQRGNSIIEYEFIKKILNELPYKDFLNTNYWKIISKESKKRDQNKCRTCTSNTMLSTHHRGYEHRGEEFNYMSDLITLCSECHKKIHNKNNQEIKYVKNIQKNNNSKHKNKSISQYSKSGEFIKNWKSSKEACKSLGIFNTNISACCIGKLKTAGGFIWKFNTNIK